jgi:hypothetical protein
MANGIINAILRPSGLMLLAGATVLGFLLVRNYSSGGTPPATEAISQDVRKRKHGKVKKGARDPIKTEAGTWVYGNVANDDIAAGEGWAATGQMNNRALQWNYGKNVPFNLYPQDDYNIAAGVIPYIGMDLSGADDGTINEVVKKTSPKAMYARMIKRGY